MGQAISTYGKEFMIVVTTVKEWTPYWMNKHVLIKTKPLGFKISGRTEDYQSSASEMDEKGLTTTPFCIEEGLTVKLLILCPGGMRRIMSRVISLRLQLNHEDMFVLKDGFVMMLALVIVSVLCH